MAGRGKRGPKVKRPLHRWVVSHRKIEGRRRRVWIKAHRDKKGVRRYKVRLTKPKGVK